MLRKSEALKNRKFIILLCVELILILIGMAGLFGKPEVVVGNEGMDKLLGEGVSVPAGVYSMRVYYDAHENGEGELAVTVSDQDNKFKTLLANTVYMDPGLHERECQFYLLDSVDSLRADLDITQDMEILGLELVSSGAGSRIYLFWLIGILLVLNSVLVLAMYQRKQEIPVEKQLVIFGIPFFVLIASLPLLVDYNIIGADIVFHMMRIENLAECIRRGELSVRIESTWMAGHGYANSIFYGDTCLYFPALLRIMGFPMDSAYRIFLAAVNLATALVAYVSFSKCFRSRLIGMFGCALYTLAPYRLYNMYNRAAAGEFTAMIFLPLLVWGFYRIYTEDPDRKGYLWNWVIPVIGFSGIIQSHLLSCEMSGFFVVLLCLCLWKKTFRKRTFCVLFLTVAMTIAINAWFLVPCLDLMTADQYAYAGNSHVMIQERGIYPAQIFYTLQNRGSSSRFVENGMMDTEPIGMGAALLLCMFLWLALCGKQKGKTMTETQIKERAAGNIVLAMTGIALFMSTSCFPWDFLSSCNRLFATLVGSLQFPTRITSIVSVLAVFVACVTGVWILREGIGFLPGKAVLLLIVLVSVMFGNYQVNDILMASDEQIKLYSAQNVGTTAVLGAEFMPEGSDVGHMTYHAPVLSDGIVMEGYEKDGLSAWAQVMSESGEKGYIEFPMLYYKGYRAEAVVSGEKLPAVKGDNCDVRVWIPSGFQGNIHVWYAGMWYWRLAEAVSLYTGMCLQSYYILKMMKKTGGKYMGKGKEA